jgi:hypothetical protein
MDKQLLLLIVTMILGSIASIACEQTVRTICDDSMDYRIEAYNHWVDEYNLDLEEGEPECEKVTREKEKKPWPQSAYNFYDELMSEYCSDVPTGCQLDPLDTGGIDASKSAIEDCFGELLRDAESCYTFSVDCQMSLTAWLNSPEGECLTLEE